MSRISRRDFIERSMFAAASAAAAGPAFAVAPARRYGPNETINVGVVGVRGRGRSHIGGFSKISGVNVTALCDVDKSVFGRAMKGLKDPACYQDMRKMVEDKSIDLVTIATCNHTHSLLTYWALQAGKHVYVEKPCSHNVIEGGVIAEAARKYKRMVQHGTQCRSSKGLHEMFDYLWSGKLGKVKYAHGLCYKRRGSIGIKPDGKPPDSVDYNLWLGPAPVRPFNPNRFHYNWHWNWAYGNGDIGNQGVHQIDIARWGLQLDRFPERVVSVGERLGYEDDGETDNTQIASLDFGDKKLIFEVRGLKTDAQLGAKIGVIFHCENGYVVNPSYTSATAFDLKGNKLQSFSGGGDHFGNLIDAIRSNDRKKLNAEILEGHRSAALGHLANVSSRLGKPKPMSAKDEPFKGDKEANEIFVNCCKHLDQNGVDLKKTPFRMGRELKVDPKTGHFVGDAEASKMLTRDYRKPFVVPKQA